VPFNKIEEEIRGLEMWTGRPIYTESYERHVFYHVSLVKAVIYVQ
jgi:hypothetical protein